MSVQSSPSPQRSFSRGPLASLSTRASMASYAPSATGSTGSSSNGRSLRKKASVIFEKALASAAGGSATTGGGGGGLRWGRSKSRETIPAFSHHHHQASLDPAGAPPAGEDAGDRGPEAEPSHRFGGGAQQGSAEGKGKGKMATLLRSRKSGIGLHFKGWNGVLPATGPAAVLTASPGSPSTPTAQSFVAGGGLPQTAPALMHLNPRPLPAQGHEDAVATPTAHTYRSLHLGPATAAPAAGDQEVKGKGKGKQAERRRSATDYLEQQPHSLTPRRVRHASHHHYHPHHPPPYNRMGSPQAAGLRSPRRREARDRNSTFGTLRGTQAVRSGLDHIASAAPLPHSRSASSFQSKALSTQAVGGTRAVLPTDLDGDNPFAPPPVSASSSPQPVLGLFAPTRAAHGRPASLNAPSPIRYRSGSSARANLFGAQPGLAGGFAPFASPAPPRFGSGAGGSGSGGPGVDRSRQAHLAKLGSTGPRTRQRTVSLSLKDAPRLRMSKASGGFLGTGKTLGVLVGGSDEEAYDLEENEAGEEDEDEYEVAAAGTHSRNSHHQGDDDSDEEGYNVADAHSLGSPLSRSAVGVGGGNAACRVDVDHRGSPRAASSASRRSSGLSLVAGSSKPHTYRSPSRKGSAASASWGPGGRPVRRSLEEEFRAQQQQQQLPQGQARQADDSGYGPSPFSAYPRPRPDMAQGGAAAPASMTGAGFDGFGAAPLPDSPFAVGNGFRGRTAANSVNLKRGADGALVRNGGRNPIQCAALGQAVGNDGEEERGDEAGDEAMMDDSMERQRVGRLAEGPERMIVASSSTSTNVGAAPNAGYSSSCGGGGAGCHGPTPTLTDSSSLASSLNSSSQPHLPHHHPHHHIHPLLPHQLQNHREREREFSGEREAKRRSLPGNHVGSSASILAQAGLAPSPGGAGLNRMTLAATDLRLAAASSSAPPAAVAASTPVPAPRVQRAPWMPVAPSTAPSTTQVAPTVAGPPPPGIAATAVPAAAIGTPRGPAFCDAKPSLAAFEDEKMRTKVKAPAEAQRSDMNASPFVRGLVDRTLMSACKPRPPPPPSGKAAEDGEEGAGDDSGDASFLENSFEGRLVNPAVAALAGGGAGGGARNKPMPATPMKAAPSSRMARPLSSSGIGGGSGSIFQQLAQAQHSAAAAAAASARRTMAMGPTSGPIGLKPFYIRPPIAGPSRLRTSTANSGDLGWISGNGANLRALRREASEGSPGPSPAGGSPTQPQPATSGSLLLGPHLGKRGKADNLRRRSSGPVLVTAESAAAKKRDSLEHPRTPTRTEQRPQNMRSTTACLTTPTSSVGSSPTVASFPGHPAIEISAIDEAAVLSTPQLTGGRHYQSTPPSRGGDRCGDGAPPSPMKPRPVMYRHASSSRLETARSAQAQKPNHFEEAFERCVVLGSGQFGEVYRVVEKVTKLSFAIKKVKASINGAKSLIAHAQEVAVLRHLSLDGGSPFVIHLVDAWMYDSHIYIQTEFCAEGTLQSVLNAVGAHGLTLGEDRIWKVLAELAQGLHFIHSHDVLHLDMKPANIFIGSDGSLKIGDFGQAVRHPQVDALTILRDAALGYFEHLYDHPHSFNARDLSALSTELKKAGPREGDTAYITSLYENASQATDVFALGMIILEAVSNVTLPLSGPSWTKLRNSDFSECDFGSVSSELATTIKRMMHRAPEIRFTTAQLVAHPILQQLAEMRLRGMEIEQRRESQRVGDGGDDQEMDIDSVDPEEGEGEEEEEAVALRLGATERPPVPKSGVWTVVRGAVLEEAEGFSKFLLMGTPQPDAVVEPEPGPESAPVDKGKGRAVNQDEVDAGAEDAMELDD